MTGPSLTLTIQLAEDVKDGAELLGASVMIDAAGIHEDARLALILAAAEMLAVKAIDEELQDAEPGLNTTFRHPLAQNAARLMVVDQVMHLPQYPPGQGFATADISVSL